VTDFNCLCMIGAFALTCVSTSMGAGSLPERRADKRPEFQKLIPLRRVSH